MASRGTSPPLFEEKLPRIEAGRRLGIPKTTVCDLFVRFRKTGLSWPLPPRFNAKNLDKRLYRLCEQERSFVKPLRFDADDDTLPDFWLTDTDGERALPMEVFGMSTPDYIARRDDKITLYNDKYSAQGWWFWDATARDAENNIATFPPKAGDGSGV